MENTIFNQLINKVVFDYGNGITNFGFHAKLNNAEISFFVNDSKQVQFDDFGAMKNNKWVQDCPNDYQLEVMQKIIDDKIENFPTEDQEMFSDFDGDYYNDYGLTKEMFY